MRVRASICFALAASTIPALGCLSGAVYTHVTRPLDVNLDRTPVHLQSARGDRDTLQYSYFRLDWGSDGIGDLAQRAGFKRLYYADVETLSVLGVWTERWVHVYGERPDP